MFSGVMVREKDRDTRESFHGYSRLCGAILSMSFTLSVHIKITISLSNNSYSSSLDSHLSS